MITSGTFTAVGNSAAFLPSTSGGDDGKFNASLWGTFVATVRLERSFDGTTWLPMDGLSYTAPTTRTLEEPEEGVVYRWSCTAFTSGTVNYRLSE